MKFDFVIGNPPYQDNTKGDNDSFAPPIYDKFMDAAYSIADKVELIHPARFLFNAGSTPKKWNKKMLEDVHFKILERKADSKEYFPNTDIKGGVAISYRDAKKDFGAIEVFTPFNELNSIRKKVTSKDFKSLSNIIFSRTAQRLTQKLHDDNPWAAARLSKGHLYDMSSNIFDLLPEIFHDSKPNDEHKYAKILGRTNNHRICKYIHVTDL